MRVSFAVPDMISIKPIQFGVVLLSFSVLSAHAQEATPFRTRNLSPLISIFGLPAWHAPQAPLEVAITNDIANHHRFSLRGPDLLVLDGETWRTSLFLSKTLADAWSVSIELPYYRVSGGVLDDVIDAWHSAFGLPDGGRNNQPEGNVQFQMARGADAFYSLTGSAAGLGDAQLGIGYRFGARDDAGYVNAWVKLPTGDESILGGSGATDWAVSFLRPRSVQFKRRSAGYYWGVGLLRLGQATQFNYGQRTMGYTGVVGGSLSIARRFGLKVQLDMHSALYRSPLEEIGEKSYQATVGGWWTFSDRGVMEFGVNEDLQVSTSPDVVLHMNIRWAW